MFNARSTLHGPTRTGRGPRACGASGQRGYPLGGGAGYREVVRPAGSPARNLDELLDALASARAGDTVYVAGDAVIECTERVHVDELVLELSGGVTLASDRGIRGAPGGLIRSDTFATNPLIQVTGSDARVSGLRLQGPNPRQCLEHHSRAYYEGRGAEYYYRFPTSVGIRTREPRLRVDNCELAGWSLGAVYILAGDGHRVQHCFIHHNQYQGLGYGVCLDEAETLIEGNLFDANRHSIAGTGRSGSGYEARDNVEMGRSLGHCFDMHGGRDRQDGTNIAGGWMHIHHNTFRVPNRRALLISGTPEDRAVVEHNWFHHRTERGAIVCEDRVTLRHNAWGRTDPVVR